MSGLIDAVRNALYSAGSQDLPRAAVVAVADWLDEQGDWIHAATRLREEVSWPAPFTAVTRKRKATYSGDTGKALCQLLGLDPSTVISLVIEVAPGQPIEYRGKFIATEATR